MQADRERDIEVLQRRVRSSSMHSAPSLRIGFETRSGNVIESVGPRFVRAALGQAGYFVPDGRPNAARSVARVRFWVEADLAGKDDRRGRDHTVRLLRRSATVGV
jgi:hypothetical protein